MSAFSASLTLSPVTALSAIFAVVTAPSASTPPEAIHAFTASEKSAWVIVPSFRLAPVTVPSRRIAPVTATWTPV